MGTPVSAKFKGAFCEATIKSVKKTVKFKVTAFNFCIKNYISTQHHVFDKHFSFYLSQVSYKDGSGSTVVNDELIEGDYKVNLTMLFYSHVVCSVCLFITTFTKGSYLCYS